MRDEREAAGVRLRPLFASSALTAALFYSTYRPHDWQTDRKVNQQTFCFHNNYRRPFVLVLVVILVGLAAAADVDDCGQC